MGWGVMLHCVQRHILTKFVSYAHFIRVINSADAECHKIVRGKKEKLYD